MSIIGSSESRTWEGRLGGMGFAAIHQADFSLYVAVQESYLRKHSLSRGRFEGSYLSAIFSDRSHVAAEKFDFFAGSSLGPLCSHFSAASLPRPFCRNCFLILITWWMALHMLQPVLTADMIQVKSCFLHGNFIAIVLSNGCSRSYPIAFGLRVQRLLPRVTRGNGGPPCLPSEPMGGWDAPAAFADLLFSNGWLEARLFEAAQYVRGSKHLNLPLRWRQVFPQEEKEMSDA